MQVDQWVDQLIAAVRRRLTSQQLREAEVRAEVAPGYLRKAHGSTRNIMLAKFLRICEGAHLDPTEIFAEVFPTDQPTPKYGVPIPQRPVPNIVKRVRALIAEEEKETTEPLPRHWLEWLDELRYDKPERALALLESTLDLMAIKDLPLALGVWASTCRLFSRYDEAFLACLEGLELVRRQGDGRDESLLLRRMSFLISSISANYRMALEISEQATLLALRSGDMGLVGKILVDQGIFLGSLERLDEADRVFTEALNHLEDTDRRSRVAALQGLGIHSHRRGNALGALEFADQASKIAIGRFEVGKLRWLCGCAHAELQTWNEAMTAFNEAFGLLLETSAVDAALVVCDHVRALLDAGSFDEARVRSRATFNLIEPLANNLIASAAIRDLQRCEQEGKRLNEAFLLGIKKRIEKSRRTVARRQATSR